MEHPVIIFGANHIGRTAKEIFESNEIVVYGFLDDNKKLHTTEIDEVVVLGSTDDDGFLKLIGKKCEAFIAVDNNRLRNSLVQMLQEVRHVQPINATHRHALLSPKSEIGHGNLFDIGCTTGPGSRIGSHCILGANSHLGTESVLGNFVQVGPGAIISAGERFELLFAGRGAFA